MNVLAYLFLLAKSMIYGSTPYFTGTISATCDVLDLLSLRFLLSLAVMWLLKSLKVIRVDVGLGSILRRKHRPPGLSDLLLAGLFEPVLYMLFETLGISMSTSITTAVLLSLSPISACLLEFVFFRTHPTPLQGIFLGCGIFGAIYIAVNTAEEGGSGSALGILFLILAVLSGNLFCAFSRRSSGKYKPFEITYISCLLGAVSFNAVNVVRHLLRGDILHYFDPYLVPENILGFLVLGVASTILATAMNNYAIARVPMSTHSAFGGVSTLVTVAIGVLLGGECLRPYHLIGLPFVFARMIGVSAITMMQDKKRLGSERKSENGGS